MLWALLLTLGLIKLVVASLMLWLPFRYDSAMVASGDPPRADSDEEGGSKVSEPGTNPHPRRPLPRLPRRGGPHGAPWPAPRPRVRAAQLGDTRRSRVSN